MGGSVPQMLGLPGPGDPSKLFIVEVMAAFPRLPWDKVQRGHFTLISVQNNKLRDSQVFSNAGPLNLASLESCGGTTLRLGAS